MDPFQQICLSQTNCYLLKAGDGYLLIDCGSSGDERIFLSKLDHMGIRLTSIRYLLLTHHHSDHCGLLPFLLSENPGISVIMSDKCAAYLGTGCHYRHAGERYAGKALSSIMHLYGKASGKLINTYPPYYSRACDVLWSGQDEVLPNHSGIHGRLLNTPGHTEDSISLIVGEHAFVGDAARNMLNFLGAAYEPILYYDHKACYESWAKLLSAGANYIHPAHGRSFPARSLRDRQHLFEKHNEPKDHPFG